MLGLRINNVKYVAWFSSRVTDRMKKEVLDRFPAGEPNDSTTYLGYLVPKEKVFSRHYQAVKDKVERTYSGWKIHTLSHAGRLTLLKYVMQSIPIYYMGGHRCPK
jgi:hypothetical protein